MKKFFSRIQMPGFFQDKQLQVLSIIVGLLAVASIIAAFFKGILLGFLLIALLIVVVFSLYYMGTRIAKQTSDYVANLAYRIKRGEQEALIKMPIGILLYDEHQKIQWANPYIQQYLDDSDVLGKTMAEIDPDLADIVTNNEESEETQIVHWGENQFEIISQKSLGVVYLLDITRYARIEDRYYDEQIVIGQVFIDNYDEVTQSMDDQEVANLNNYVTNKLTSWATEFQAFLKRVDDDHHILVTYAKSLRAMESDKFKFLDEIRQETSQKNYPVTLSLGIAYGDANLVNLANTAQNNLDLALGRGGDQVVVKSPNEDARFYGGKTNPMEKRTRVRARMIAQAIQDIFQQADQVFVMGHAAPDMDAIGAALGIRRIAQMNHKQCYIVLDQSQVHTDVKRLLTDIQDFPEIEKSLITPDRALAMTNSRSLLLMVDHSKPSISTSPELYDQLQSRTIIIDHHRRGQEFPENPMLVYIEPYASSTCELITEMLEYQPQDMPAINKLEATAMLAGITVDTKSFSLRTGTRTFDAASYLRSVGADGLMVQNLLKENVDDFIQRNHLIDSVEMVRPNLALCVGEESRTYDPVTAAQAADTLLSLSGIEASFVISKRPDGKIGISARSTGEVNVQVIMEKLGGGGHLSNAATQIEDASIAQVRQTLVKVLTQEEAEN
ncbi:DHH family phosphoesterase [Agrilactobacillus yilanensis]|uniref:Cyclic-di-AMP phosphodiesterase n=1 Tax=Agrilactobacillus yilanensis TaxID=2485997 RepID=A0ABW4J904_9LACO|nr:DHH family phosphoesterase [Agrilactobacillus yilanensis]